MSCMFCGRKTKQKSNGKFNLYCKKKCSTLYYELVLKYEPKKIDNKNFFKISEKTLNKINKPFKKKRQKKEKLVKEKIIRIKVKTYKEKPKIIKVKIIKDKIFKPSKSLIKKQIINQKIILRTEITEIKNNIQDIIKKSEQLKQEKQILVDALKPYQMHVESRH